MSNKENDKIIDNIKDNVEYIIEIRVLDANTNAVIEQAECYGFESAAEHLGKMERHTLAMKPEDVLNEIEDEEHYQQPE